MSATDSRTPIWARVPSTTRGWPPSWAMAPVKETWVRRVGLSKSTATTLRPLERAARVRRGLELERAVEHQRLLLGAEVVVAQEVADGHGVLPGRGVEQRRQRGDERVELVGGDDERRREPDGVGRHGVDDEARVAGRGGERAASTARSKVMARSSPAPRTPVTRGWSSAVTAVDEVLARGGGVGEQALVLDGAEHREAGCCSERVAAERRAVLARGEQPGHLRAERRRAPRSGRRRRGPWPASSRRAPRRPAGTRTTCRCGRCPVWISSRTSRAPCSLVSSRASRR